MVKTYTVEQIAEMRKVSVQTIRNHCKNELLKSFKIGGRRYVTDEELKKYLEGKVND